MSRNPQGCLWVFFNTQRPLMSMSLWLPRPHALQNQCRRRFPTHTRSLILRPSLRHQDIALTLWRNRRPISTNPQKTPSHAPPSISSGPSGSPASSSLATATDKPSLGPRVWKAIKDGASHYWHGTKLLVSEVRISARLQWKLLHGEALTRREKRQVRYFSCHYPARC